MSNTPNPRNARKRKQTLIVMAKLHRDGTGNVYTPKGYLPGADYERVRNENPHLALPALADLPLVAA